MRLIIGLKQVKEIDETTIIEVGNKYGIPTEAIFELDTAYLSFLFSLDTTTYQTEIKNHYQPLQALYYSKKGDLLSFQINCYAGGFPNLNWERDSIMQSFPPLEQAPLDSILPLPLHLDYIRPLKKVKRIRYRGF